MTLIQKLNRARQHRIYGYMITFLVLYGIAVLFMFQTQRHFIYVPGNTRQTPQDVHAPEMEVIAVQPEKMKAGIEGWYAPPADPSKPVIVYFHGNAMTIPYGYQRVAPFIKAGYGMLLAEYRGYNGNPGKPTEKGLYADADAYVRWLKTERGIPENRIVFYGLSLGTGLAIDQAVKNPDAAGMILEAPYTSLVDVARRVYFFMPVDLLMLDRYPSKKKIGSVDVPLLVLHGQRDTVIPASQGRTLFDLAREPKLLKIYPDGGHADLVQKGAIQDTLAFLKSLQPEGNRQ